jgi:hypothetical protein
MLSVQERALRPSGRRGANGSARRADDEPYVLSLQRQIGNANVVRAMSSSAPGVQRACACGTCADCGADEANVGEDAVVQRDFLDELEEAGGQALGAVGQVASQVVDDVTTTGGAVVEHASQGYEQASASYQQASSQVSETASNVSTDLGEATEDPLGAASKAADDLGEGGSKLASTMSDAVDQGLGTLGEMAGDIGEGASKVADDVGGAVNKWLSGDPGSAAAGGVPNRKLGDTPGSRTPEGDAGTKESEAGFDPSLSCVIRQGGRVLDELKTDPDLIAMFAKDPNEAYEFIAKKAGICAVAKCLPPGAVVQIIEHGQFAGQPHAKLNLNHYIAGSGADLPQDMPSLLGDAKVSAKLAKLLTSASARPGLPNTFSDPLEQSDYANPDWLNALGGVDTMVATILADPASRAANRAAGGTALVRVSLNDPYQWHPNEGRVTECLHELFEAMKSSGAAEYNAVGTGVVALPLPPALIPT